MRRFILAHVAVSTMAMGFSHDGRAQDCSFSLGADTTLCNGQYLMLHGPTGTMSIEWQNGFQSQNISATETGTYWCTATFAQPGLNQVVNGDFSGGDTLFSTDFIHGTGGAYGLLSAEGTYAVTSDPSLVHINFAACGDHTGGGNMLVVNGSPVPNADIWCQTVNVVPNTYYAFSAWLMSVTSPNPAEMDFLVNGTSLGTPLLASSNTCEWAQFYAVWNSGANTTATICIINQQLAVGGNDFALDDIAFSPLCSFTDSIDVTVLPPAPDVDLGSGGALCPGTTADVQAVLVPEWTATNLSYTWNTGAHSPGITVPGPGTYTVLVDGPCIHLQDSVTFTLDICETDLSMPNVFTPDGNGVNDGFGPIYSGEPANFHMEIRNRWGQVLFTSSAANARWNGRAAGGPVPDGTYFWTVDYGDRMADGSVVQKRLAGHVTLLRGQ